eukprot:1158977-Pelagomonas_calceolata.AAC.7
MKATCMYKSICARARVRASTESMQCASVGMLLRQFTCAKFKEHDLDKQVVVLASSGAYFCTTESFKSLL